MPMVRDAIVGSRPARTLVRIGVLIVASVIVFGWVLIPIRTYGDSMRPTYSAGSLNFVNRAAYFWRSPARGDVVAVRLAGLHAVYVKRIVAMPGERLAIRAGEVFVNGARLDEPYVVYRGSWDVPEVAVPEAEYLVIGDNRGMRVEEHEFGRIKRERIAGRLLW
jgi:signal peptidase I